jgi:hypothetical protein
MIWVFPRTPDRLPKFYDLHVQLSEVWKTMIGTCGPYNSGGSATHRIFIFQSSSIQISKINANSNLSRIFLLNRHNIRDPLRIPAWLNKTRLQELINFFFNSIINCRIESAGLLLNGLNPS